MEIGTWTRRVYRPAWGGNREDAHPVEIEYRALTVAQRDGWQDLAIEGKTVLSGADLAAVAGWQARLAEARERLLREAVIGVRNMSRDGIPLMLSEAIAFLLDYPDLADEVSGAILSSSTVDAEQGKG